MPRCRPIRGRRHRLAAAPSPIGAPIDHVLDPELAVESMRVIDSLTTPAAITAPSWRPFLDHPEDHLGNAASQQMADERWRIAEWPLPTL
jgi:hypothetical protein